MKKTFLLAILLALSLTSCGAKPAGPQIIQGPGGSYMEVTPAALKDMLKHKDFLLVNVHIPSAGDLAGTDLSIPYDEMEQNLSKLPADLNAKIVLYCWSGHMSTIAAEQLVSLGYTNVWSLKGGMQDWEKAGYRIQK
jgi:rhodanese-related sulfurtransferase